MDNFRRTIPRRHKLLEFIQKRLDEVLYNCEPIGYCLNEGCTSYKQHYHNEMQNGMLEGIVEIERALNLLKKSIEDTK